ncbi:SH3 domain-containing protein [Rhodotorula diobovata]|uniref:SH3 domain-containing protein n=1 Tax=Rhodotorula diobovata TaxID=5288 RepID=A0A5C5FZR1_9BASI|nr:SH3 domain-containing protein [Rhodotorula diobovata]
MPPPRRGINLPVPPRRTDPNAPPASSRNRVAGGFDASSKRALAKALLSSNGPMSREEERKKKEAGPGPLAVAVPRTYNGAPPPRRGAAAAVPSTEERVRALYDYVGTTAEDLSVREGEELVVVERVDADWTRCKSSAGAVGLVPSTYVQSL